MNKKASGALAIITVILAIVLLGYFLIDVGTRGCNSNKDCPEDSYCGADNECHQYPKQIIIKENNFLPAAAILALGLVLAAIILRIRTFPKIKKPAHHTEEHDEH